VTFCEETPICLDLCGALQLDVGGMLQHTHADHRVVKWIGCVVRPVLESHLDTGDCFALNKLSLISAQCQPHRVTDAMATDETLEH
jgi:hypothetical protein